MRLLPACLITALCSAAWIAIPAAAHAATTQHPAAHPAHAHHPASHARRANAPTSIGTFDDWQAATHVEGGKTVCYAFTRSADSTPAIPGRGSVIMTVTERPGSRDAVALSAGFTYAKDAAVHLQSGSDAFELYTAQRSAFARDGHAAVTSFGHEIRAVAVSPAPRGSQVTDTFSLKGFTAAYAATQKACPAT